MGRGARRWRRSARSPPTPRRRSTRVGAYTRATSTRASPIAGAAPTWEAPGSSTRSAGSKSAGFVELRRDYRALPRAARAGRAQPEPDGSARPGSCSCGSGSHRRAATRDRLRELISANVGDEALRAPLSAVPGRCSPPASSASTISGRSRADRLLADRDPETGLWEQNLGGKPARVPRRRARLCRLRARARLVEGAAETARHYAIVEDGLANWPPSDDGAARPARGRSACSGATARPG